ncbi:MAG: IS1595 family transposase [Proteobacteria bacterium]|nr:IS1595 family transposase [Pseudomonadota bacterium]
MSALSEPHFHDETAAFEKLESLIWPEGPVCPHCGGKERIYKLQGVRTKPSKKHPKGVERPGLKKCGHCRKQFTIRIGTIFEDSHIPLHKWFQAMHLMCSSKKGISSHQLHRTLEITYEAAWFMSHRIREAMRSGGLAPMGGGGSIVEIDETYIGNKGKVRKAGTAHKHAVLTLVSRDGEARSFHINEANQDNILPIIRANLAAEAKVITDDAGYYRNLDKEFLHAFVNHSAGQYGRGEIHTNTIEGYFSIFKRGMKGVYQHCSEKHLHRYLAEFDFRYSNRIARGVDDKARAVKAIIGAKGKRLTYRSPDSGSEFQNAH